MDESHISIEELQQQGFRMGAIWHLLGQPHLSQSDVPFAKDRSRHFYRRRDVDEIRKGRAYHLWRLSDVLKTAVAQMRRDTVMLPVIRWAESVEITT